MQKRWSICDFPQDSLQEVKQEDLPKREEEEKSKDPKLTQPLDDDTKKTEEMSRTDPPKDNAQNMETFPLRKCRSSFDLAMDSLRKEIVSTQILIICLLFGFRSVAKFAFNDVKISLVTN